MSASERSSPASPRSRTCCAEHSAAVRRDIAPNCEVSASPHIPGGCVVVLLTRTRHPASGRKPMSDLQAIADREPRARHRGDPHGRGHAPAVIPRGSNATRIRVISPFSTRIQFATGTGGAMLVLISYQVSMSGPASKTFWVAMPVRIRDSPSRAFRHSSPPGHLAERPGEVNVVGQDRTQPAVSATGAGWPSGCQGARATTAETRPARRFSGAGRTARRAGPCAPAGHGRAQTGPPRRPRRAAAAAPRRPQTPGRRSSAQPVDSLTELHAVLVAIRLSLARPRRSRQLELMFVY